MKLFKEIKLSDECKEQLEHIKSDKIKEAILFDPSFDPNCFLPVERIAELFFKIRQGTLNHLVENTDNAELVVNHFLRHGKCQEEIDGYFTKLIRNITSCSNTPDPVVSTLDSLNDTTKEKNQISIQTDLLRPVNTIDEKNQAVFKNALKCALHPLFTVDNYCEPAPPMTRQNGFDLTNVDCMEMVGILERAFQVNKYLRDDMLKELSKSFIECSQMLQEDLYNQKKVLQSDSNIFYNADDPYYEDWKYLQLNHLDKLLNNSTDYDFVSNVRDLNHANYHEQFEVLIEKLLKYDFNEAERNKTDQSTSDIPASTSLKISIEFGLRFGVGGVFRKISTLSSMVKNFVYTDVYLYCLKNYLSDTMIFLEGLDRQYFLKEKRMIEHTLEILHQKLEYCFEKVINLVFSKQKNVSKDGVYVLVELLERTVRAKCYFRNEEQSCDVVSLVSKCLKVAAEKSYSIEEIEPMDVTSQVLFQRFKETQVFFHKSQEIFSTECLDRFIRNITSCSNAPDPVVSTLDSLNDTTKEKSQISIQTDLLRPVNTIDKKNQTVFKNALKCTLHPLFTVDNYCEPAPPMTRQNGIDLTRVGCMEMVGILERAFQVNKYLRDDMLKELSKSFNECSPSQMLQEDLYNQKKVLQSDSNIFYNADDPYYEDWKHLQLNHLDKLLNNSTDYDFVSNVRDLNHANYHEQFEVLIEKLLKYDFNEVERNKTDQRTSDIPASTSLKISIEFGLRFGVEEVFRKISTLSSMVKNFVYTDVYLYCLKNYLSDTMIFLEGLDRQYFLKEKRMIEHTLEILHQKLEYCFEKVINLVFSKQKNVSKDGVYVLVELLERTVRAKCYFRNEEQSCDVVSLVSKCLKVAAEKSYSIEEIEPMDVTSQVLFQRLKETQVFFHKSQEIFSTECLDRYNDLHPACIAVVANTLFSLLIKDVEAFFQNISFTNSVDRDILHRLVYCLNKLDEERSCFINRSGQTWRNLIVQLLPDILKCDSSEFQSLIMLFIKKDNFSILEMPRSERFQQEAPNTSSNHLCIVEKDLLMVTSSLSDLLYSCSELAGFVKKFIFSIYSSDNSSLQNNKVTILQQLYNSIGSFLKMYSSSLLLLDICGVECLNEIKKNLNNQIEKEFFTDLIELRKSVGCRHCTDIKDQFLDDHGIFNNCTILEYLLEKSGSRIEPVTKQMCYRINNVYSILCVLPVIKNELADSFDISRNILEAKTFIQKNDVMEYCIKGPCLTPINDPSTLCPQLMECRKHLKRVLKVQMMLLVSRVEEIFLRLFKESSKQSSNRETCLNFLSGQINMLKRNMYAVCLQKFVGEFFQRIELLFHDVLCKILSSAKEITKEKILALEKVLNKIKGILTFDSGLYTSILNKPHVIMFRLNLVVYPIHELRNIYNNLYYPTGKLAAVITKSLLTFEEVILNLRYTLPEDFYGHELTEKLRSNKEWYNVLYNHLKERTVDFLREVNCIEKFLLLKRIIVTVQSEPVRVLQGKLQTNHDCESSSDSPIGSTEYLSSIEFPKINCEPRFTNTFVYKFTNNNSKKYFNGSLYRIVREERGWIYVFLNDIFLFFINYYKYKKCINLKDFFDDYSTPTPKKYDYSIPFPIKDCGCFPFLYHRR